MAVVDEPLNMLVYRVAIPLLSTLCGADHAKKF